MNPSCKTGALEQILLSMDRVAVAFSGGMDSTFLAAVALQTLGADRVVAVTARSATFSADEEAEARETARQIGVRHVMIETDEFSSEEFTANTPDRCYFCKKIRFESLVAWADGQGFSWVIEGSHADDLSDFRPGRRAIAELDAVRSPLEEAGWTRMEIREASRRMGLQTGDKPSEACLATRIAYGLELTTERLRQVEEAEKRIRLLCEGTLRVRHHGDLARIEVERDQIATLAKPDTARRIAGLLSDLGFRHVTLDLSGYRTGSMNLGVV